MKNEIPSAYNMWDFYVALNMIKSDHCNLFRKWWNGASDSEIEKRYIEATVNYLNDEDNPLNTDGKVVDTSNLLYGYYRSLYQTA